MAEYRGWLQPCLHKSELALWFTQMAVVLCLLVIVSYGRKRLELVFDTQREAL